MYKLLLCWRYLLTRYLALACIVSVMLGVATLIVVNSVMSGFSTKLRQRLHGLISDVVIEANDYDGFWDPDMKMAAISADPFLNPRIVAMTPTLEVFAMLQFYRINGEPGDAAGAAHRHRPRSRCPRRRLQGVPGSSAGESRSIRRSTAARRRGSVTSTITSRAAAGSQRGTAALRAGAAPADPMPKVLPPRAR